MSVHLHRLTGCTPVPLAGYLKALGILRVVAEQRDATARGWWQDEHFCLLCSLDSASLEQFFLQEYSPSPFVSPWNKGSGFYSVGDPGLTPIERSTAPRLAAFQEGIRASRALLDDLSRADAEIRGLKALTKARPGMRPAERAGARALKADPDYRAALAGAERRFKELKATLLTSCRNAWRGRHREWLDAAAIVVDDTEIAWPSLLGTGGNDGRLDFTNNAMQRLGELFDLECAGEPLQGAGGLLSNALWGAPTAALAHAAVGQFHPGGAGGANSTSGPEGDSSVNPWDFLLMLEGAILFRASATKRFRTGVARQSSAPFALRSQGAGIGTHGQEGADRGEQWLPLWRTAASLPEVSVLLGEGRIQLWRQLASRPIDAARAIGRLGVSRGIRSFVRFGFLERNGQSTIAVPLNRIEVASRASGRLIDELAPWVERLEFLSRSDQAPSRLKQAHAALSDAIFSVLTHDDSPWRWQAVLHAAVEIESIQASGTAIKAGPMPPLSHGWLDVTHDGTAEWRLACALASGAADYRAGVPRDGVRRHWLPLEGSRYAIREDRLIADPGVVANGRDSVSDFIAVVIRRLVEASQQGERQLPLQAAPGYGARPEDLVKWLSSAVDDAKVAGLARAFMAVRWRTVPSQAVTRTAVVDRQWPEEAWQAVRLACLPWPLDANRNIPVDQAIVSRLHSGDAATAVGLALRRLRSAGLVPRLHGACADPSLAMRWAAALAFPVSPSLARQMASRLESTVTKENR